MRAFTYLSAAAAFGAAMANEEPNLRGPRKLYPATFGGYAWSGPTRNFPVNACFGFKRYPDPAFWECDGKEAADAYCRERGYNFATKWEVAPLEKAGSTWVEQQQVQVEAGIIADQHVLKDVTCET